MSSAHAVDFDPASGRAIMARGARKPRLGVFRMAGTTFATILRRPGTFMLLVPLLCVVLPSLIVWSGFDTQFDPEAGTYRVAAEGLPVLLLLLALPSWILGVGLATLAANEELGGARRTLHAKLSHIFRNMLPVVVLGGLAGLAASIPNSLLLFPVGLWVMAVWFVLVPAILVDGAGWGALAHSSRLTKEYRWPIVGLLLILLLVFCLAPIPAFLPGLDQAGLVITAVLLVPSTVSLLAAPAVVHARLIAIKNAGYGTDVGSVFE